MNVAVLCVARYTDHFHLHFDAQVSSILLIYFIAEYLFVATPSFPALYLQFRVGKVHLI